MTNQDKDHSHQQSQLHYDQFVLARPIASLGIKTSFRFKRQWQARLTRSDPFYIRLADRILRDISRTDQHRSLLKSNLFRLSHSDLIWSLLFFHRIRKPINSIQYHDDLQCLASRSRLFSRYSSDRIILTKWIHCLFFCSTKEWSISSVWSGMFSATNRSVTSASVHWSVDTWISILIVMKKNFRVELVCSIRSSHPSILSSTNYFKRIRICPVSIIYLVVFSSIVNANSRLGLKLFGWSNWFGFIRCHVFRKRSWPATINHYSPFFFPLRFLKKIKSILPFLHSKFGLLEILLDHFRRWREFCNVHNSVIPSIHRHCQISLDVFKSSSLDFSLVELIRKKFYMSIRSLKIYPVISSSSLIDLIFQQFIFQLDSMNRYPSMYSAIAKQKNSFVLQWMN